MKHQLWITLLIATNTWNIGTAQTQKELDSIQSSFNQGTDNEISAFDSFSEQAKRDYLAYVERENKEFERYVRNITKVWGDDSIKVDTQKDWVEYSNDFTARSIVDFDNGTIEVEVALKPDDANDPDVVRRQLAEAVNHLLDSRGSTCPYRSTVDVSQPLTNRPILTDMIDLSRYNIPNTPAGSTTMASVGIRNNRKQPSMPTGGGKNLGLLGKEGTNNPQGNPTNSKKDSNTPNTTLAERKEQAKADKKAAAERLEQEKVRLEQERKQQQQALVQQAAQNQTKAKAIVEQSPIQKHTVKGDDGQKRTVVKVTMQMVTDHISRSAALYKDMVATYSERFQIEQPLIYAIIEQESAFNPRATSGAPAYGLMQLVPRAGGADAYRFVYKKDIVPTQSYLYDPQQNIELGTAYLRVLMNQFARVVDANCRRLCVIASYNTGAGNVSRSFIGTSKLSNAFGTINALNYDRLFSHLTSNLSTSEARNYVRMVSQRREKYMKK